MWTGAEYVGESKDLYYPHSFIYAPNIMGQIAYKSYILNLYL